MVAARLTRIPLHVSVFAYLSACLVYLSCLFPTVVCLWVCCFLFVGFLGLFLYLLVCLFIFVCLCKHVLVDNCGTIRYDLDSQIC